MLLLGEYGFYVNWWKTYGYGTCITTSLMIELYLAYNMESCVLDYILTLLGILVIFFILSSTVGFYWRFFYFCTGSFYAFWYLSRCHLSLCSIWSFIICSFYCFFFSRSLFIYCTFCSIIAILSVSLWCSLSLNLLDWLLFFCWVCFALFRFTLLDLK